MRKDLRRRAGRAVATLLAVDGLFHLYWTTGLTWPAPDDRTLSLAVLGAEVPFTPRVLLPLVVLLSGGAAGVLVFTRGPSGRWVRRASALVASGVAAGLLVRGLVGVVWIFSAPEGSGDTFQRLNLLLYTPVCLVFGAAAVVAVWPDRGIRRSLNRPSPGTAGA
ncbi:DUF3995 domain-containing protein [Spirillospora sp. NPDC049652]